MKPGWLNTSLTHIYGYNLQDMPLGSGGYRQWTGLGLV